MNEIREHGTKFDDYYTILVVQVNNIYSDQYGLEYGLEPGLGHYEKSCLSMNFRQFTTNIKIKIIPVLLALAIGTDALTKLV